MNTLRTWSIVVRILRFQKSFDVDVLDFQILAFFAWQLFLKIGIFSNLPVNQFSTEFDHKIILS